MRFTTPIIQMLCFLLSFQLSGQDFKEASSQKLDVYQQAKVYAFEEENYTKAIDYISEALAKQPNNTELELFQYRLYFWGLQHELAQTNLTKFVQDNPSNLDAHNLLIDVFESRGLHKQAIKKCESALEVIPNNLNLIFRMAYNQSQNEEFIAADNNCQYILSKDPNHTKAINLRKTLKPQLEHNFLIAEYQYFFLDTPKQALNFYNLQYARRVKKTTLIGKVNMAKSYIDKGFQYSLEMYIDLGKKYYSYSHISYSISDLFPELRINAAIYKAMANRMEGSVFITFIKADEQLIRVLSPSLTKHIGMSAFTLTGNIINEAYDTEITYRARFRQHVRNSNNYVGLAIGSFSRNENIGQMKEQSLVANYVSYEAQINLGQEVRLGLSYNRSITKKANARDQLSVSLKHSF